MSDEKLEKGWKGATIAAGLAIGGLAANLPKHEVAPIPNPTIQQVPAKVDISHQHLETAQKVKDAGHEWQFDPKSLHPELHALAHNESSFGYNVSHAAGKDGLMDTAQGAVGMKPKSGFDVYAKPEGATIRKLMPGITTPQQLHDAIKNNPQLYNLTAHALWTYNKNKVGGDLGKTAFVWRFGLRAAQEATPEQITSHPYVQSYLKILGEKHRFNKTEELSKAQNPKDFKGVLSGTNKNGKDVVDHTPDLDAHPPHIDNEVKHYRQRIVGGPDEAKTIGRSDLGISAKTIFHGGPEVGGKRFMVKPYHEDLSAWGMNTAPIHGWAEMTNQALYHSAGIGHLHQKVHVSEHLMSNKDVIKNKKEIDTAKRIAQRDAVKKVRDFAADKAKNLGVQVAKPALNDLFLRIVNQADLPDADIGEPIIERHPAVVVHMENGLKFATDKLNDMRAGRHLRLSPSNKEDIRKIHIMDFLVGNLDRHGSNLLFDKNDRPLAIDHGLAFQYNSNEADRLGFQDVADRTLRYFEGQGEEDRPSSERYRNVMANWWAPNRENIIKTFENRLLSIKDPKLAAKTHKNFMERVKWLDNATLGADPNWYLDPVQIHD